MITLPSNSFEGGMSTSRAVPRMVPSIMCVAMLRGIGGSAGDNDEEDDIGGGIRGESGISRSHGTETMKI